MNIEERRECIVKVFARYLYGHLLPLSFHASTGGWTDWANLVRRLSDSLQHPRNRQNYDFKREIENLQEEMVDFATTTHTSRFYPVVPHFKEKLYHQVKALYDELSWTMSNKLIAFLLEDKVELITSGLSEKNKSDKNLEDALMINEESEYLFKTYEIVHGKVCKYYLNKEGNNDWLHF